MAKDHNEVEIERQKSAMVGKGYVKHIASSKKKGCFPAETQVLTPQGWERIADLFEGNLVLSYAPDGRLTPCKVAKRLEHNPCAITTVYTANSGIVFDATEVHAINTTRGWVRISKLKAGDIILQITEDGKLSNLTVLSLEDKGRIEPVYNLVEKNYTFVVQSCIAHSFSYFRKTRVMLHEFARHARFVASVAKLLPKVAALHFYPDLREA